MNAGFLSRLTAAARRAPGLALAGSLLLAAGCAEAPTSPDPGPGFAARTADVEPLFNPQPDPPMELFRFTVDNPELVDNPNLIDNPNLRPWTGSLLDPNGRAVGDINIEQLPAILPAVRTGTTLHLRQQWTFITDGTSLPAVQVSGVLSLVSGRLVLNGVAEDSRRVHIQGWYSVGDVNVLGGELMFNPQPDPPLEGR